MNDNTNQEPSPGDAVSPLPALVVTPRRSALLAGHDNTLDVLVRVQAPGAPAATAPRQPLHLSLVIDRSGSMSGQPLAEARRCAEFVLDGLQSSDRLAVVTYDDGVDILVPATAPIADTRETIRAAIRRIDSGGSTDLHGGWLAGVQALVPHVGPQAVSRVILLSDGCANAGLCDPHAIWTQCREVAAAGIGTSTYGLGRAFNEELMIGMARTGQGRSYYGATAEDLMDPFREEFELLNAACARRLKLEVVAPRTGVKARLLNDYAPATEGCWWLPDLAYSGEAWAVLRLKVPAEALATPAAAGHTHNGHVHVISVALRYQGVDGEPRAIQPLALALPVLSAAAFAAVAEDELVVRRVGELEAADLQRKARDAALRGDWRVVGALLQRAEKLGADNPWIAAVVGELHRLAQRRDGAMFAKQSAYGSLRMSTRLAACSESPELHDASPRPAYLRRKANPGKGEEPPKEAVSG